MSLTPAQLKLYQERSASKLSGDDSRLGAKHDRMYRGFIKKPVGKYVFKYYPLKLWPPVVGLTNQALRYWLRDGIITATKEHRMYVMCLAEQKALASVLRGHRYTKHSEITSELVKDLQDALRAVRAAIEILSRAARPLTPAELTLLQVSINDR